MKNVFAAVAGASMIAASVGWVSAGWAGDLPVKAVPVAVVGPPASVWTLSSTSELKYYTWRDNLTVPGSGTTGSELYTPVTLQMSGKVGEVLSIDLVGRGGWVNINTRADDFADRHSTVTDSNLSANFTYLGFGTFQPFVGLQTSLPTGRTGTLNTQLDPDLVEAPAYGGGFDVGSTAGFNILASSEWLFTTSATYTARGSFGRDNGAVPLIDPAILAPAASISLKPGDNVSVLQSVTYNNGGAFFTRLAATVTFENATFQDGIALMKPGNSYTLSSDTNYTWSDIIGTTTLSASVTHSDAAETLQGINPAVAATVADTGSNVYTVSLQHLVPINSFFVGPVASYLFRDNAGINASKLQFTPTKQRYAAGLLAQYNATPNLTLNARVEGVWTHLDADQPTDSMRATAIGGPYIPVPGTAAINGSALWTTLGLNYRL